MIIYLTRFPIRDSRYLRAESCPRSLLYPLVNSPSACLVGLHHHTTAALNSCHVWHIKKFCIKYKKLLKTLFFVIKGGWLLLTCNQPLAFDNMHEHEWACRCPETNLLRLIHRSNHVALFSYCQLFEPEKRNFLSPHGFVWQTHSPGVQHAA